MARKIKKTSFLLNGEFADDDSGSETMTKSDKHDWDARSHRTILVNQGIAVAGTSSNDGREHGGIGLVTFCSSDNNTAWHDHPSTFAQKSSLFKRIFAYEYEDNDPCDFTDTIERISVSDLHFKLLGVSNAAFEAFLRAVRPGLEEKFTVTELKDLLLLSTQWNFPTVRDYAMKHLPSYIMDPLEKIELARAANVPKWLTEPYIFFCRRVAPLTKDEGRRLGIDVVLAIYEVREKLARSRQLLIAGYTPSALFGYSMWTHSQCWQVLGSIWSLALTDREVFKNGTPDTVIWDAVLRLEAPLSWERKRKTAQSYAEHFGEDHSKFQPAELCRTCRNARSLANWTNPAEETTLACTMLTQLLPPFVDRKFGYEDLENMPPTQA